MPSGNYWVRIPDMTSDIGAGTTAGRRMVDPTAGLFQSVSARRSAMWPDRHAVVSAAVRALARQRRGFDAELRGLAELVCPGDVCVDVGAAAGLYTAVLSDLVGPTGQVHSVEPLRFAHPVVAQLLAVRRRPNVQQYRVALAAEPGVGTMSVPISRYGMVTGRSFLTRLSNGLGSNAEFSDHIEVVIPVETLDALCRRAGLSRLDFLKADVEGAELSVLEGGIDTIDSFRPTILLEIESRHLTRFPHSASDIVDWLGRRGYTMHAWCQEWRPAECICEHTHNYLFLSGSPRGAGDGRRDSEGGQSGGEE